MRPPLGARAGIDKAVIYSGFKAIFRRFRAQQYGD